MIEVIAEADATPDQLEFVRHWSNIYFRPVGVDEEVQEAPVLWRVFLSDSNQLTGHVAVSELPVEIDGKPQPLGAIGGLFVTPEQQGRGFAAELMDRAEDIVFQNMKRSAAILFCMPELVSFYQRRHWAAVNSPVSLKQDSGKVVSWPHSVMFLPSPSMSWKPTQIDVT